MLATSPRALSAEQLEACEETYASLVLLALDLRPPGTAQAAFEPFLGLNRVVDELLPTRPQ